MKHVRKFLTEWTEHKVESILWICLAVPTFLYWKESILWVAFMSLYANFKTAVGAHEAHMARKEGS